MRDDVKRDMSDAAFDFQRLVWPAIAEHCGGGEFVSTEQYRSDPVAQHLDMCAGIDGIQIRDEWSMVRGFALRVQWCQESFDTFTIRLNRHTGAKTEFEKRTTQIQLYAKGAFIPWFTVQAYVTKRRTGHLLKAAITTTSTLYRYLHTHTAQSNINGQDGNEFLYVPWAPYLQFTKSCVVIDGDGRRIAP